MEDAELHALERVKREIASLDKSVALIDRELPKKLGQEDASRLMDYARAEDVKILSTVVERINEFRGEVRAASKHTEEKFDASLYRATTEMESRLMARLDKMAVAASAATDKRFHPVGVVGGAAGGASVLWVVLQALGIVPSFGG